jgi:hypothetical protein
VSKFFENNLDAERWHKALVEKMGLEIPGVRPALLGEEKSKRQAMELLKFRRRFRDLYGEDLDPVKTADIQGIAEDFFPRFAKLHADFIAKLRALARDLARRIKEKDGAVRGVILFGSMAEGVPRNSDFDIDLALDGGDAYRAMDIKDESSYEVELRLLPPRVRKRILERGIALP